MLYTWVSYHDLSGSKRETSLHMGLDFTVSLGRMDWEGKQGLRYRLHELVRIIPQPATWILPQSIFAAIGCHHLYSQHLACGQCAIYQLYLYEGYGWSDSWSANQQLETEQEGSSKHVSPLIHITWHKIFCVLPLVTAETHTRCMIEASFWTIHPVSPPRFQTAAICNSEITRISWLCSKLIYACGSSHMNTVRSH